MTTPKREPFPGTLPPGAQDQRDASRRVREMFARIAPRYDLLNHVLSIELDRFWRWRVAQRLRNLLDREDARVLDLCCGTGDLTAALARAGRAQVVGSDFAHPMLVRAVAKSQAVRSSSSATAALRTSFVESDTLELAFAGESFDVVTAAFGFRNLANYESGFREIYRVLRPGGQMAILEFCVPRSRLFGGVYQFYFHKVLPWLGGAISGDPAAYKYLPGSVERFPEPEELLDLARNVGFVDLRHESWTGGTVALLQGRR